MELWLYALFALFFTMGYVVQGTLGFGASVVSLPFLAFFFPLRDLIPVIIAVNIFQSGWLVVSERKHIDKRHTAIMLLFALLGMPLGFLIYKYLPADDLKIGLGIFVIAVAARNLSGLQFTRPLPAPAYYPLLFLGGVAEGAIATGGPFIVIYAARWLPDKTVFRASLSVLWAVLNLALCGVYTATGTWTRSMLPLMLIGIPCTLLGTWLGLVLHDRVPQKPFRTLVFIILIFSGLCLLRPFLESLF